MPETYDASSIVVLQGLEAIRRRPGMYIGDVHDGSGLHHMIWEVVGNVIDLHLAGKATRLSVDLSDGWVEVRDDGPGFPVERAARGKSAVELVFTTLHAGPTRDGHFPHVHIGRSMYGVGVSAVNALSVELEVETRTRGRVYRQRFSRGLPTTAFEEVGRSETTGARVRFRPDPEIFSSTDFDEAAIRARLRELAFLNPMLTIDFGHQRFRERDGIAGYAWTLAEDRGATPEQPVRRMSGDRERVRVDVALTWLADGAPDLRSYVSQFATRDGGTHVEGFWEGLREGVASLEIAEDMSEAVFREVFGQGLVAVVHAGLYDPCFGAPTRDRLASPEARSAVRQVVAEGIDRWCRVDAGIRRSLLDRLPG